MKTFKQKAHEILESEHAYCDWNSCPGRRTVDRKLKGLANSYKSEVVASARDIIEQLGVRGIYGTDVNKSEGANSNE